MELDAVKQERKTAEEQIQDILHNFTSKTGCAIYDIRLEPFFTMGDDSPIYVVTLEVKL